MTALDLFLKALSEPGQGQRVLHRLPEGSSWMLFSRQEEGFRLFLKIGYRDEDFRYSFLEEQPELWSDALTRGAAPLPSSVASMPGRDIWIVLDSLPSPEYILVIELPGGFGGSAEFFRLLLLSFLPSLADARRRMPAWLDRMLPMVLRSASPLLLMSEEGSGADLLVRFALEQRFCGQFARFSPGRLAADVQMREFSGDSTGERLRTSAAVPVLERAQVVVVGDVAELAMPLQLRILSELSAKDPARFWVFETSRDLRNMAQAGQFDAALADILLKNSVTAPPLRKCRDEILAEADRFLQELFEEFNRQVDLSDDARKVIREYAWPGNLSEFHGTIEAAYLMSRGGIIRPADLKPGLWHKTNQEDLNLRRRTEDLEMQLVLQAHSLHGGNQVHMARALGLSRGSLQYRMNRMGLGE